MNGAFAGPVFVFGVLTLSSPGRVCRIGNVETSREELMTQSDRDRALDRVYAAGNETELADAYAAWASDYDRETAELGYCLPFLITSWLARYLPPGRHPVLDAGCGTGLSGPYLRALGYDHVEGFDMSPDMIALAASRNCYAEIKQAQLGRRLPYEDGRFAAIISSGVFTEGHAPAEGLRELARITTKGGHVIFTLRDLLLDRGFQRLFDELEAENHWRLAEKSPPMRAFVVAEPEVLVNCFVFERI
jgi:predicted TPR repeat methyltransferase